MPVLTIEYQDAGRLGLEQAIAFFTQMRQTAQTAADGTVLAACEQVAVNEGRSFLRNALAAAVHSRVAQAEKKGGPLAGAVVACAGTARHKGSHERGRDGGRSAASGGAISLVQAAVKAFLQPTACWE